MGPLVFSTAVITVLVVAWLNRHEGVLTADSGIGYWLGIVGAVIMLMLVGYPMRKRFKSFANLGRVANWFRLHMILGILGPTLIILHSNFKLGSLNSRLALLTMLIVVASGIAGRYLYAKVHKGLYGKQVQLRDVLADIGTLKIGLGDEVSGHPAIMAELEKYQPKTAASFSVARGLVSAIMSGMQTRASRHRILRLAHRHLAESPTTRGWTRRYRRQHIQSIDQHLRVYFAAVKKAQRLAFFEKIFSLWHHLHMPLFILLTLTVVMHIVAVHLY
jgi:hypothetical protein